MSSNILFQVEIIKKYNTSSLNVKKLSFDLNNKNKYLFNIKLYL